MNAARPAYTLAELAVSLVIMTLLLGGTASAIYVSTRAMDQTRSQPSMVTDGEEALTRVTSDLTFAVTFSEWTSQAVTFSVPDRDADGDLEILRYAWSGVAGAPLTYEYNGSGQPVSIADNVHFLNFTYLATTKAARPGMVQASSAETILFDDFESGGLLDYVLSGGGTPWAILGDDVFAGTKALVSLGLILNLPSSATRSIDTTGYYGIVVEYARKRVNLGATDSFTVSVSPDAGVNWTVLESTGGAGASDANFLILSYPLAFEFGNNAQVRIRFTLRANLPTKSVRVDNLRVTGMSGVLPAEQVLEMY